MLEAYDWRMSVLSSETPAERASGDYIILWTIFLVEMLR